MPELPLGLVQGPDAQVKLLNDDAELCERVMAVYEALRVTFDSTGAYRLWENSNGDAFLRMVVQQQMVMGLPPGLVPGLKPTLTP